MHGMSARIWALSVHAPEMAVKWGSSVEVMNGCHLCDYEDQFLFLEREL